MLYVLSIDSIGTRWATWRSPSTGWSPMRCVGLSGSDQLGMGGLQFLEPLDQPVVLAVADLRGRLDVVFIVVAADFFPQPGDFLGSSGHKVRVTL